MFQYATVAVADAVERPALLSLLLRFWHLRLLLALLLYGLLLLLQTIFTTNDPVRTGWSIRRSCSSEAEPIFSTRPCSTPQASAHARTILSVCSFRPSEVVGDPASMRRRQYNESLAIDVESPLYSVEANIKRLGRLSGVRMPIISQKPSRLLRDVMAELVQCHRCTLGRGEVGAGA